MVLLSKQLDMRRGDTEDERLINNIAYKASIGFFMSKSGVLSFVTT